MPDAPDIPAEEVMQTCAANHVRMAARGVTRIFDRALQPCGLKVTQFTILMVLAHDSFASITEMADRLSEDLVDEAAKQTIMGGGIGGSSSFGF